MDQESQRQKLLGRLAAFKVPLLFLMVILIGAVGFYFYTSYEPSVNHLIEGVPYYGIFNLFQEYSSPATTIATILRYFNDERVSFRELNNEFPGPRYDKDNLTHFQKSLKFFEAQGYNTFSIKLLDDKYKDDKIGEIKKYIRKDIPVIVIQQKRLDTKESDIERSGWRVVIGVFDDKKEIIVHDASLGNNYVFSYADFEKLFFPGASRMLAVWPKDTLAQDLSKPGNGLPYSERSSIMENAYDVIGAAGRAKAAAAASDVLCDAQADPTQDQISEYIRLNKESIRYRDEATNNPAFKIMPPIFQFRNKLWKAKSFMRIGELSKAREIVINELIPANKDLDKTVEGFEFADGIPDVTSIRSDKLIDGQMPFVYELLMYLYWYEGRYKEAINAYMPYFKLDPDDKYALRILSELRNHILEERISQDIKCMGGRSVIK